MLVSQNEMKKNGIDLSVVELENKFMQLGHEVEGVTSFENDKLIVGYVETCENHPNADKLNVAKVNLGKEVVQIVCGASNICAGIFVIVAINGCKLDGIKIKKVELKGIESNGMICSLAEIGLKDKVVTIEDKEGIFIFDFSVNPGDNALEALGLKDNILELSLTANRGDCLSYVGLVRDISALVKSKNKYSFENVDATINNTFTTKLSDESSTLLSSMLVENIVITPSPSWLKIWLAKIDIKSQNLIVDLASYVMFTLGTPIHTYDAAKISGGIKVINLDKSTKFIGLDELEYNLKPGNLVIEDDEKIVSLASVLGSNQTKVTNDTTNILIEIGIFNPVSVRKTATVIGKKTDASIRGEKNIDHHQIENAYNLFCTLLKESNASAKFSNVITKSNEVLVNSINHKFSDVNKIVGIEIPKKEIISNLEKLQFLIIDESDEHLIIQVPSWRFDIKNNHDLIEEVIRIYSMEKIETKEVMSSILVRDKIIKNPRIKLEREMEASLINLGLNQIMTYSLVSEEELVAFGGDLDIAVELMMPLSSEHQYYRQSLLPSALKIAKYNLDRQQKTVNICEIGNCYTVENNIIKEEYFVAGVLAGVKTQNYNEDSTEYNFYDAKYVVESL
ncbi:MAG: phenylalanine--tRNA ligase subunit beta, partial [Spiroplasma sp.]|nr:phenylalanine--tRNA ligase subunit beta [Mycoplasmatales bacterium]